MSGGDDKWMKVLMEEKERGWGVGDENRSRFIAPSMFIKTLLSLCERAGSLRVKAAAVSVFQPPNYAIFNQTAQKQTVKRIKSEMEIHSPFSMHSP